MSVATKPRLHVKASILGYRRSRLNVRPNQVLVRIPDVRCKEDASFYCGKIIAYYYKKHGESDSKKLKTVWGKIIATHGNSGVLRAKFKKNLCGDSFAKAVRVFLYPSSI